MGKKYNRPASSSARLKERIPDICLTPQERRRIAHFLWVNEYRLYKKNIYGTK